MSNSAAASHSDSARQENTGPLRIDLEEAVHRPEAKGGLLAQAKDRLAAVDRDAPPDVELITARLCEPLFELLECCDTQEIPQVRVRVGSQALGPEELRRLGKWRARVRVEFSFDELPGSGWLLSHLGEALRALEAEGVDAGVTLVLDEPMANAPQGVVDLAMTVAAGKKDPLHLSLRAVSQAKEHGRAPVSFSRLLPLLECASQQPKLIRIRSRDGTPLCLFPGSRRDALMPATRGGSSRSLRPEEAVFAEDCERCALRESCSGVSIGYAAHFGTDELQPWQGEVAAASSSGGAPATAPSWADKARLLLVDRPDEKLFVEEIVPVDQIPDWPCVLPWRRLEMGWTGVYGPCCPDWLVDHVIAPDGSDPRPLWNSDHMQAIRAAMTSGEYPSTCRPSCPVPRSGLQRPGVFPLQGGSAEVVEHQISLVEDMLEGRTEVRTAPLDLCVAVTSFCNYDCVMCRVPRGPPEEQLGQEFYDGLSGWFETLLLFDANGGEPLASKEFRDFLARTDFSQHPSLRFHVTTNGSYLTPSRLDRYTKVPFSSMTISINAATAETYDKVNRGVSFDRIRENLDGLLKARREGRLEATIRYSMVILKSNVHEIIDFARMAQRDAVGARFLLPTFNLNDESIMNKPETLRAAQEQLHQTRDELASGWDDQDIRELDGVISVIDSRLAAGLFEVL